MTTPAPRPRASSAASLLWPAALGALAAVLLLLIARPLAALFLTTSPGALLQGLRDPMVLPAVRLSLVTTTASLALVVLTGTPLAWLLSRRRGRAWRWRFLETLVQLPVVLPPAVAGVALLLAFGRRGMLGPTLATAGVGVPFTRVAVVLAQTFVAAPFYVQAALSMFKRMDPDMLLVARTLGASRPRVFFRVVLPLSRGGLAGGAALSWARALGEFGATLMFAGNLSGRTQTLPLAIYTALESDLRTAQSLSLILLAVAFALLVRIHVGARR